MRKVDGRDPRARATERGARVAPTLAILIYPPPGGGRPFQLLYHNLIFAKVQRRKGRAVSYTPMGNKPKRERFEPGEKGDAKWVEAVDKWRRKNQ